ncbi:MAG: putative porin [bacterium]
MKKYLVLFLTCLTFSLSAQESNNYLLYKLQQKGIITETEAQVIRDQTSEEEKAVTSSSLTAWTKFLNAKGDFRFRYQNDHPIGYSVNRDRVRVRVRGGIEPKITDNLKVGIALATGMNNNNITDVITDKDLSRSPNQTLGSGFSKKAISLDLAFAEYTPISWMAMTVGKFKNPIWTAGDLIWDTDINPEGAALKFNGEINPNIQLFGTADVFTLGENATASDPLMYVAQAGIKHKITDKFSYKTALSYYGFSDTKGKRLDGSVLTNSINSTTKALIYDYKNLVADFSLDFKNPFGEWLPYVSLFAEYVNNMNAKVPGNNRDGYMIGTIFGKEKLAALCDWQVQYNYGKLAKDAVLDIFPDSDRYGGQTAMKSHELIFNYALASNNSLGLDLYYGEKTEGALRPATVLQLDWNIKF